MEERRLRSIACGGIAAILCATMVAAPVAVHATDDCYGVDVQQPLLGPPLEQPAVFVTVTWDNTRDYVFSYDVTTSPDPLNDPNAGEDASWAGGCQPPSPRCNRPDPLVITEGSLSWQDANGNSRGFYNNAVGAGTYAVLAETKGFCYFPDGSPDGLFYDEASGTFLQPNMVAAPDSVPVTAKIEAFDGEGNKVFEDRLVAKVPIEISPQSRPSDRRMLGTFEWDPATGISNLVAAEPPAGGSDSAKAAELPPPDPLLGTTIVGSVPGPDDFNAPDEDGEPTVEEGPAEGEGTAEVGPAYQPEKVLSGEGYFWVQKLLLGIALSPVSDETRAEALSLIYLLQLLRSPDAPVADASADDLDEPDDTPVEAPQSALDALAGPEDDASVSPPVVTGPDALTFVGEPPDLKAEQQKQMQNQGRVWVQLPAKAKIDTGKSKKPKHTLKTKTWYQVKLDPDGTQVFYSKKGELIGTNLGSDAVQVRVWVPQEQEQ